MNKKRRLSAKEYINGIQEGNRVILSQAITLIESAKKQDVGLAEEILSALLPQTGKSIRIGVTGVPGRACPNNLISYVCWICLGVWTM